MNLKGLKIGNVSTEGKKSGAKTAYPYIQFMGSGSLEQWLRKHLKWIQRIPPEQLNQELLKSFAEITTATKLYLSPLPLGMSGAAVLQVTPYHGFLEGSPFVIKIGKRGTINQEQINYHEFVSRYIQGFSMSFGHSLAKTTGIISYQLIDSGALSRAEQFGTYYENHDAATICLILDTFFRNNCARWYNNRKPARLMENMVQLYTDGLNINWEDVWSGAAAFNLDLNGQVLRIPNLASNYLNPKWFLEQRNYKLNRQVWQAMTHGDLNEKNLLITLDNSCWLVDFYRTGWGHILRDFVELETAIKFNLVPIRDLEEYQQFEMYLLNQSRLDEFSLPSPSHSFYKPLMIISHLRRLADRHADSVAALNEYKEALFLSTLNLLRFNTMQKQYPKILLSASMLSQTLWEQR